MKTILEHISMAAWKTSESVHIIPAVHIQFEWFKTEDDRMVYALTFDFVWLNFNSFISIKTNRNENN